VRRATSFVLSLVVVPAGVLAAPVVTRPAPDARPVPAHVQDISLAGTVSAAGLATGDAAGGARTVVATTARSTQPFETFGVTWRQDPHVGDLVVRARTRTEGRWTAWTTLDEEASADGRGSDAGARAGTEPAWVGPSDGVQVRVEVLSGQAPADLRLSLVDPGESPADAAVASQPTGSVAEAATGRPVIRSRAAWGADETMRTGSPSYASSLYAVTVHHTASSNSYEPEDVPGIMRSFYAYHTQSRGWSDIGYNVIVDKYGTAWEGRAGGLDKPVIGAHAGGFNTGTVGVSIIGTYDSVQPTNASLEKVAAIAAWKLSSYGRDPKGTVTLTSGGSTKYSAGTRVTLPRIFGHRDVSSTACPGVEGYAALPEIRERAAALVAAAPVTTPAPEGTPTPVPEDDATDETDGTPTATPTPTPTPTTPPSPKPPFGSLDAATGGTSDVSVRGWAVDPDAATYTSVAVSVDGAVARTFVASQSRPDVSAAYPQYSANHGFSGTVPAAAGTRTVCATARNQGTGTDVELGCRSATVGAAATPSPSPSPTPAPGPAPAGVTAPPPARATDDSCPSGRVPAGSFRDTAGSVHAAAIDCAVWWQLTGGTTPTTYSPGQGVTRAQMASFLARLVLRSGGSLPSAPPDAFSDDAGTSHQTAINQLAAVGVIAGKGGRSYDPAGVVRRDQMATFLVRAYEYRTSRTMAAGANYFADDNGNTHEASIGKAARAGFTGGSGDGRFQPGTTTDRGQMASFLTRVLDLLVEAGDAPERA
jgi:hypothetical protein